MQLFSKGGNALDGNCYTGINVRGWASTAADFASGNTNTNMNTNTNIKYQYKYTAARSHRAAVFIYNVLCISVMTAIVNLWGKQI